MQGLSEHVSESDRTEEMASVQERVAKIEERVKNHIRFFWVAVGTGFIWLAGVSGLLYQLNGNVQKFIEPQRLESLAKVSPKKALTEIATANPKTFSTLLPALRTVVEQPVGRVQPAKDTLAEIAAKLRETSEDSPDYWPTVLQFIQFATAGVAPAGVPPHGSVVFVASHGGSTLSFDNETLTGVTILVDGGKLIGGHFIRCRIIFTNNPVDMRNVDFADCVFEMPITSQPNPSLKGAARQLLASNLSQISIPSL